MSEWLEFVNFAIVNNVKIPLLVSAAVFALIVITTGVLVARELKRPEK